MRKHAFIRSAAGAALVAAALSAGSIKADAAPSILFDLQTGAVLEHREAFQRWHPASLTKLMTAYVAFRAIAAGEVELTSPIKMTKHAVKEPPSKMGYKPGQVLTLDNALKILMVKSANDVATAVGENIGGSEKDFAARMNAEAARLGMSGSRFVNAHGLHSPDQYTTARDLAVLVRAIRTEFPQYASYFDIEALLSGKDVIKTNVVLLRRFDGADGMKTGFICASGFNLASTATRDGRTLAAVVLGAESSETRAEQAAAMLARGFASTSSAGATLATLEPYGADRDKAADLKKTICSKEAASERWSTRDENGKPVYHSPYLHEPNGEPQLVVVGLGGATGKVPPAMQAAAELGVDKIPMPEWRPDRSPFSADSATAPAQASTAEAAKAARDRRTQRHELTVRLPIPVSIVTGFLGAGKTTLVNRLLKDPALADTAVIVNEFGAISIDHLLVEQSSDGVIQLADGCLCCSVRGELVDTLIDLLDRLQDGRIERLSRVVIETTGLADPAPVLQSIMGHPALLQAFRLDGVITVVDALNGAATLEAHVEALKQAAMADRIVLTKLDMAEAEGAAASLRQRLGQINPNAPILDVHEPAASAAALLKCGLYDPQTKTANVARWLGDAVAQGHDHMGHAHAGAGQARAGSDHADAGRDHGEQLHGARDHGNHDHRPHDHAAHPGHAHPHHERVRSLSLVHDRPLPFAAVETFLHLLRSTHGDRLLRLKGIIELAEDPSRPMVVHGVQKTFHPPAWLAGWPDAVRGTRMVLIGIDLPEDYVRRLFAAISGEPAIDMPDRAALQHNPLAIAGT